MHVWCPIYNTCCKAVGVTLPPVWVVIVAGQATTAGLYEQNRRPSGLSDTTLHQELRGAAIYFTASLITPRSDS